MSIERWRGAIAVIAIGIGGVALLQPRLANQIHDAKAREDVYLFPPPAELEVATLGYRAAVVDMLWVKLRIEYGTHFVEKRAFPDAPHYLDAILALEPDYAPVFRYVDTILCYHEPQGTADDATHAPRENTTSSGSKRDRTITSSGFTTDNFSRSWARRISIRKTRSNSGASMERARSSALWSSVTIRIDLSQLQRS